MSGRVGARPLREPLVAGLGRAAAIAARRGVEVPPVRGKLLRPRVALAFVPDDRRAALADRFWLGCLAVQMAHEASLQHDDVLDRGMERRDADTVFARHGARAALLAGDLYLTGAYRVAHMVRSEPFLADFTDAVEATVRGERMQGQLSTATNPAPLYGEVVRAKSGALFGVVAALPGWMGFAGRPDGTPVSPITLRELGVRLGAFYQAVDDLLDYCPESNTGKPKLQDFANRAWTSALGDRGWDWFERTPESALAEFFRAGTVGMAGRAAAEIRREGLALAAGLKRAGADPDLVDLVTSWIARCRRAVARGPGEVARATMAKRPPASPAASAARIAARALALGPRPTWGRYFARHSRSFSFASLLFPAEERRLVREIYAFCRFTDDLVDDAAGRKGPPASVTRLHRTLDAWEEICRAAYEGERTGVPLADAVMAEAAERGIPFELVAELIEGVRMDVEPRSYRSMDDLRRYTYRVASVVGAWLTRAFGVDDPWVLKRAHALGHAMQLTNIVRDVGEDLALGRVYLPADRMAAHGVSRRTLLRMQAGAPLGPGYVALLEEMMADADAAYEEACEGLPYLPASCRRPVTVAAQVYRGIHDRVRANHYDNLNRRAYTSLPGKIVLGRRGLGYLRTLPRGRRARHLIPTVQKGGG
ncbi:squalene/phytoene synthase family protein [Candidatus Palauibacter sp.]|uniref:squalene/phytoene synthase family protein n=1 Tax=Candidatus Palauibacter sp. TaxID=3101350 RepID=UPI003B014BC8